MTMRRAMNRNLPGGRLQGTRHRKLRVTVPVRRPAYPVEDIYAGRGPSEDDGKKA